MTNADRKLELVQIADVLPVLEELAPGVAGMTEAQWAAHDARVAAQREADALANAPRATDWAARGLPQRALDELATADPHAPAMLRMSDWHRGHPRDGIAVLSGPPGCGKTVAATWWAREVGALFVRSAKFAVSSRYDRETRDVWLNASTLVLDDLGTEYVDAKGSFLADLDDLIDTKYGAKHRLVITTNSTAEEFKARYGNRITDRLRECGRWMSVAGASLRKSDR